MLLTSEIFKKKDMLLCDSDIYSHIRPTEKQKIKADTNAIFVGIIL